MAAELDKVLSAQSYVGGFTPSQEDVDAFTKLKGEPSSTQHPHAFRWYRHIAAFTPHQRSMWPGAPAAPAIPTTVAPAAAGPKKVKNDKKEKPKKDKKAKPPQQQGGKKKDKKGLEVTRAEDFGRWYEDLVKKSGLIEYYDISGCYILRPWAFRIWEFIQQFLDDKIKSVGVENAYFPLFVSQKNLCAEEDHIEDFAPEVAWVTKSGQSELDVPIAVRATSETIMYPIFSDWIHSHRDLPLKLNQWCSVVRWEFKKPTPFLRSREFLWQEGHTCHASQEEADQEVLDILEFYKAVYEELLAVPVIKGRKSEKEKFAGADYTTTVEGFIPGTGRGIQGATSHCLGKNFAHIFDITYEDTNKEKQQVIQNSWGLTTRTIGVAIMVHSDDQGLVLPPRIAPIQVVIVPIVKKDIDPAKVQEPAQVLAAELEKAGVRVKLDDRSEYNPGWKYNHWELKGVPMRIELGPKDVEKGSCMVKSRDGAVKMELPMGEATAKMKELLTEMQSRMLEKARAQRDDSIVKVYKWDDFVPALNEKKLCLTPWCGTKDSEELVKEKSAAESKALSEADPTALSGAAKTLCLPFEHNTEGSMPAGTKCFITGEPATCWALWGRSY